MSTEQKPRTSGRGAVTVGDNITPISAARRKLTEREVLLAELFVDTGQAIDRLEAIVPEIRAAKTDLANTLATSVGQVTKAIAEAGAKARADALKRDRDVMDAAQAAARACDTASFTLERAAWRISVLALLLGALGGGVVVGAVAIFVFRLV